MNRTRFWPLPALALIIAACSSGNSSAPPVITPPAGIAVNGAVVDGPVSGATISAFAVSAAGVVATPAIATTTTDASGNYTLSLPASFSGALLVTSSGGSFTDDVSGATVSAPNTPSLSVLIPNVAAGTTTVTAQLTPLTTVAAQLALTAANANNPIATVAAAVNSSVGSYFGGQSDIVGTPLVDLSTANCATTASQASVDASLIGAGLAQLAALNGVKTYDLIPALVADFQSDGNVDGTAAGTPLTVPLNGGTVLLCTIENNCPGTPNTGLAQQIGVAIAAFQKSPADACLATQSATQQSSLAMTRITTIGTGGGGNGNTFKYSYTLTTNLSGYSGTQPVGVKMTVALKCSDDTGGDGEPSANQLVGADQVIGNKTALQVGVLYNGPMTYSSGAGSIVVGPNNAPNDCGNNTWTLAITSPAGLECSVSPNTGKFSSSGGGDINTATAPNITCTTLYSVGGTISGPVGAGLVLQNNGGDTLMIPAGASTFAFATQLASGSPYDVTVQSSPVGENCVVSANPSGTVGTVDLTTVGVTCTANLYSIGGSIVGLNAAGLVLALSDGTTSVTLPISQNTAAFGFGTQVPSGSTYAVTVASQPSGETCAVGNASGTVNGANVNVTVTCSTSGGGGGGGGGTALNSPQGLLYYNNQLYVANAGGNQVLIFNIQYSGKTVTGLTLAGQITAGVSSPSRLAVDSNGYLYVANGGSGGLGNVTIYNTNSSNAEVTASGGGALISGISRPLGVAVDSTGKVYVANNAFNQLLVYVPNTPGTPSGGYAAPYLIPMDAAGHSLEAPGVIFEDDLSGLLGAGNDYVLVGLGPSNGDPNSEILYKAPFTSAPTPLYDLNTSACATAPSGPTGIALYLNVTYPVGSFFYITSFYNSTLTQYMATSFLPALNLGGGSTNPCPAPLTTSNGISQPEGVAVDGQGNVFVANSATSGTNANSIVVYGNSWTSNNTAPLFTYH